MGYNYLCIKLGYGAAICTDPAGHRFTPGDIERAADDGWELVCVDQGTAYLRRETGDTRGRGDGN